MSPDPLGGNILNPQSLNRYTYVLNNPESLVDPLGLKRMWTEQIFFLEGGCVGEFTQTTTLNDNGTFSVNAGPTDSYCSGGMGGPTMSPRQPPVGLRGGGGGGGRSHRGNFKPGVPQGPPQSQPSKQPLLVCAAETANKYSLAQLAGTNGKSGFFNSLVNGVLGNTFSTVVSYAYGGSTTEFATTAYDYGTKATKGAINAATGAAPITDLALNAESTSQIAEGLATEGLGGVVTGVKLAYDLGTFIYGAVHCY